MASLVEVRYWKTNPYSYFHHIIIVDLYFNENVNFFKHSLPSSRCTLLMNIYLYASQKPVSVIKIFFIS